MKLSELALEEAHGFIPFMLGLLFMRFVRMISPQNKAVYVVLGVPPWRQLTTNDIYVKTAYQVW